MYNEAKILYVDDEIINLKIFEVNFGQQHQVLTAQNGIEGLEKLQENEDISLIISDIKMPQMDGIEFIKRANQIYPNKKYCILSSFDLTDEIRDSIDKKIVSKYFRKPFIKREIEAMIETE